jgi:classical protein kinase C
MSREAKEVCKGFLTKNPSERLGCSVHGKEDICGNQFFRGIDWEKIETREIRPPFKPKISDPRKAENFDLEFTRQELAETPVSTNANDIIDQMMKSQDLFADFDFVNPDYTHQN